jgi:hypothetical protein
MKKALLFVLFVLVAGLLVYVFLKPLYFDDAYMFIRYAENMKNHGVFGWNADQPSYGCTSAGYVFSNYLLIKLGLLNLLNQGRFLMLHSLLYFFGGLLFLFRVLKYILSGHKNSLIIVLGTITFLLILPITVKNAVTGMDTSMSFFANTLLIYAAYFFLKKRMVFAWCCFPLPRISLFL